MWVCSEPHTSELVCGQNKRATPTKQAKPSGSRMKNQPDTHTRLGTLVIIYSNIILSSPTIYSGATVSMYCQCWDFHPKDRNRCLNNSFTIYRVRHYWPVRLLVNSTATVVSYQQVPGISPNTCWLITIT